MKGFIKKILDFIKGNETEKEIPENKDNETEATNKVEEKDGNEIKSSELKSIVVDTCALKEKGAVKKILEYPQVILLLDVVDELDRFKNEPGDYGMNIRNLLAEGAKDTKGEKIKIVSSEEKDKYTDNRLISYCKGKNVVLYTADNALALKARGNGIDYILAENIDEQKKETLQNVVLLGKNLYLKVPNTKKIDYIVYADGKLKAPLFNDMIKLNKGDNVVILTNKQINNGIVVSLFKISDEREKEHAIFERSLRIGENIGRLEELKVPDFVKRKITNYYCLVRKTI